MRVSTGIIYQHSVSSMQSQQANMLKTQQQLSTGRRILTPADDPVAAARVLDVSQAKSANEQFGSNATSAKNALEAEEAVVDSVIDLLQDVRTSAVQAGNRALNDANRITLANEMRGRVQALLGLANSTDGAGKYIFAGYQGSTKPFTENGAGVVSYNGDQGQRLMQLSQSRQIAVSDSGTDVFQHIKDGNTVTSVRAANTGTGAINAGRFVDASIATGDNYRVDFTITAGVTTYNVVNVTKNTTVQSDKLFASGVPIVVDGIEVKITGTPANGDQFNVGTTDNLSVFEMMNDLIAALEAPVLTSTASDELAIALNTAITRLDHAQENISTVQGNIGARLKEVESMAELTEDFSLQYDRMLSDLQDLDYTKAISALTQQQIGLEAAQRSFMRISEMSLFNFF